MKGLEQWSLSRGLVLCWCCRVLWNLSLNGVFWFFFLVNLDLQPAFDTQGSIIIVWIVHLGFSRGHYAMPWAQLSEINASSRCESVLRVSARLEAKMPDYIPALVTSERQPFLSDVFVHQQPVKVCAEVPSCWDTVSTVMVAYIYKHEVSSADADTLQSACLGFITELKHSYICLPWQKL